MKFQTFDLVAHIRRYNKLKKKDISLSETFDLWVFDSQTVKLLVDAMTLIDECHNVYCGVSGVSSSPEFGEIIKDDLLHNRIAKVKLSLAKLRVDTQQQQAHEWYCAQQQRLVDPKVWDGFMQATATPVEKEKLRAIWVKWMQHQDLSHYSSPAIWFVANQALMIIEQYTKYARKEMSYRRNRRKLPDNMLTEFQKFLDELEENVRKSKEVVCWAMLARLQSRSGCRDLYYDDITMSLAETLLSMKVIKCENGFLKHPRRSLDAQLVLNFQQYIEQQGNQKQIQCLHNLIWFRSNDQFTSLNYGKIFIVPKEVADAGLVPKYFVRRWMSSRRWFRHHFYRNHLTFMIRLRMLPRVQISKIEFSSDWMDKFFADLQSLYQGVEKINEECQQWVASGLWGWIHGKTNRFIEGWYHFSACQQRQIIKRKIQLVSAVRRRCFLEQQKNNTKLSSIVSVEFANNMIKHLRDLGHQVDESDIPVDERAQFDQEKRALLQMLNGLLMTNGDVKKRSTFEDYPAVALPKKSPAPLPLESDYQKAAGKVRVMPVNFSLPVQKAVNNGMGFFQQPSPQICQVPSALGLVGFSGEYADLLEQDIMAINDADFYNKTSALQQQSLSEGNMPLLQQAYDHVFQCYLKQAKLIRSVESFNRVARRFTAVESMLLQHHVPDYISLRVQALVNARQQPDWVFMYVIQAEACLSFYGQDSPQNQGPSLSNQRIVNGG